MAKVVRFEKLLNGSTYVCYESKIKFVFEAPSREDLLMVLSILRGRYEDREYWGSF